MFNNSTFCEILKLIPRNEVKNIVCKYKSDHYSKSFKSWDHLVAMLFGQLSEASSIRDIVNGFNLHSNHHYHLNSKEVRRSTLSDVNKNRSADLFKDLAISMISKLQSKKKKELSEVITLLDSTPIKLSGRGHEWAEDSKTRDSCQGLKLHVQYASRQEEIEYIEISNANVNDLTVAQKLKIEAGKLYVFDKGYYQFNWWQHILDTKANFVTRLKEKCAYRVLRDNKIRDEDKGFILREQVITLTTKRLKGGKINKLAGKELRLVEIKHPSKDKGIILVSSCLEKSSQEIASLYKERWDIELLFKWLKQNLKLKKFLGESRNAICIQIYVAIIAFVLLSIFKRMSANLITRLKDAAVIVKMSLFHRLRLVDRLRKRNLEKLQNNTQLLFEF